MAEPKLLISPTAVFRALLGIVALLVVLHVVSQSIVFFAKPAFGRDLLTRLDVEQEISVPTWFSHSILLLSATILALIAHEKNRTRQPYRRHWILLAIIVLYLSIDEGASLHELAVEPVRHSLHIHNSFLLLAWIIPGAFLVALFVAAYFRFWLQLRPDVRLLFAMSACVYLGGAMIVESLSSAYAVRYGDTGFDMSMLHLVEETMEMTGVCIFIKGLLLEASATVRRVELELAAD